MTTKLRVIPANHVCQESNPEIGHSPDTHGYVTYLNTSHNTKQNTENRTTDEIGISNSNPLAGGYKKNKYKVICGKKVKVINAINELNAAKIAFKNCKKCHLINVKKYKKNNLFKGTIYSNGHKKVKALY